MRDYKNILSLISFVAGEDIAALSDAYEVDDAILNKTPSIEALNINQRYLIYIYCCLYAKIKACGNNELEELRTYLKLPNSAYINCIRVFTKSRVEFLREELEQNNEGAFTIFCNAGETVVNLIEKAVSQPLFEDKKLLKGLVSTEYEHPTDKKYLAKLKVDRSVEKVVQKFTEYGFERKLKVMLTGSNIRVNEKNIPYLYSIFKQACEILDMPFIPKLYVESGPLNAYTTCIQDPIVVVSPAALSLLNDDEMLFLLGHELGHIKSKHVLYHTLSKFLPIIAEYIGNMTLGLGELVMNTVVLLLYNWYRMSEYTADRAGLLACQNPDAAVSVMMKLAGYPLEFYNEMDFEDFLIQADEFSDFDNNKYDKMMKYLSVAERSHPWSVARAKEMKNWVDSGEYQRVIQRVSSVPANVSNQVSAAFCNNCGRQIDPASSFCRFCGAKQK